MIGGVLRSIILLSFKLKLHRLNKNKKQTNKQTILRWISTHQTDNYTDHR